MANDSTHSGTSASEQDTTPNNDNIFTDMQGEDAFFGPEQLAQATEKVVPVPQGENVIRVQVNPGEIIELSSPFDPGATFLAREGDGNLAIKVGDVTVILQGYVDANQQAPVVIHSSDGQPIDIATLLASTDPTIDIQTAAGPGDAAGAQGQGADNTGALLSQFANGNGLGGLNAVGAQDATALKYGTIDNAIRLDREDALQATLGPSTFRPGMGEAFLHDPIITFQQFQGHLTFNEFMNGFTDNSSVSHDGFNNSWADNDGTFTEPGDITNLTGQATLTFAAPGASSITVDLTTSLLESQHLTSNGIELTYVVGDDGATIFAFRGDGTTTGDGALIFLVHLTDQHSATADVQYFLVNRLDHATPDSPDDAVRDLLSIGVGFEATVYGPNVEEQENPPTTVEGNFGIGFEDDIPVAHEVQYTSYNGKDEDKGHDSDCGCDDPKKGHESHDTTDTTAQGKAYVDEDWLRSGNKDIDNNPSGANSDDAHGDTIGRAIAKGNLNIDFGADGPAGADGNDCTFTLGSDFTLVLKIDTSIEAGFVDADGHVLDAQGNPITSGGHQLVILSDCVDAHGIEHLIVGYKEDKPTDEGGGDMIFASQSEGSYCDVPVFELTLDVNPDDTSGPGMHFQDFKFELFKALDQDPSTPTVESNTDLQFKVIGHDDDGDAVHTAINIQVNDDSPVLAITYNNEDPRNCDPRSEVDGLTLTSRGGDVHMGHFTTTDFGHVDEDWLGGDRVEKKFSSADNAGNHDRDAFYQDNANLYGDDKGGTEVCGQIKVKFGADGPSDAENNGDLALGKYDTTTPYPPFVNGDPDHPALTSGGLPLVVLYSDSGKLVVGTVTEEEGDGGSYFCETPVFCLELDPSTGKFDFHLLAAIDHDPATVDGNPESDLLLSFNVGFAEDGDLDKALGAINIKVNDDHPELTITYWNEDPQNCDPKGDVFTTSSGGHVDHFASKDYGYVDEDWLQGAFVAKSVIFAGGNHDQDAYYKDNANLFGDDKGGVEVCGQIAVKFGADGPSDAAGNGNIALGEYDTTTPYPPFVNGDPQHPALTSGGLPLVVLYSDSGKLVVGTVTEVDGDGGPSFSETPVFCLELDPSTGKFDFHLLAPLDHDPATDDKGNPETDLMLTFNVGFAEDRDGDKAIGAINIKVNDDHPEVGITYNNETPYGDGSSHGTTYDTDFGRVDEDWLTDHASLTNGNFEDPIALSPFEPLGGPGGINGWIIDGEGVDLINGYWPTPSGSQSVDMNREGPGSISTEISGLTVGREYTVSFYLGANPELQNGPKPITVNVAGADHEFIADSTGKSLPDVNFQYQSFTFIATSETEVLTFTSGADGPCGPVLDGVQVHAVGIGNQDHETNGTSNANMYGDDYGSTHVSGQISMRYGADGPGTQSLGLAIITAAEDTNHAPLSSQGHVLEVLTSTDKTIELGYDGIVVISLTLDTDTGHFNFNQYLPLDHPIASPIEDNLYLTFKAGSITDGDGDTTDAIIKIQVNDDVPETIVTYNNPEPDTGMLVVFGAPYVNYGLIDEDHLAKGNKDYDNSTPGSPTDPARGDDAGGTCVTGEINVQTEYGADGPNGTEGAGYFLTELKVDDAFIDAEGNQLKSHDNLLVVLSSDGETLEVGYHDPEGGDDTVVFTLTMTSDHEFKFELEKPLDDPQGKCDPIEQGIVLAFGADKNGAPTDRDGDPAARIVIHVNDDAPKLCEVTYCPGKKSGFVDEDYLHGGNHDKDNSPSGLSDWDRGDTIGGTKLTGQVVVEFGADGKGEQAFSFDCYKAGDCFTDACGSSFSSHGHELKVLEATADHLVVGYGDTTVFTLTIDDCGNFCFDLCKPLDHPIDCKPEEGLKMVFDVTATDFDGDAANAQINVKINDDAPTACDVTYHNQDTGDYNDVMLTSVTTGGSGGSDKIGKVDEDWLPNGNQDQDNCPPGAPKDWKQGDSNGGTCVTGCLNVKFGADGPADCGQAALALKCVPDVGCAYPNMSSPLTSGGHILVVLEHCTDKNGIETLVVGYKEEKKDDGGSEPLTGSSISGGDSGCEVVVFTLTLHTDPKDCDFQEFKFELTAPLDQAVESKLESNLLLCFEVEATDFDGDTACTDIKIQVNDDAPMVGDTHYHNQHVTESEPQLTALSGGGDTIGKVDEDWLPNGNQDKEVNPDAVANGSFEDPVVIGDFSTLAGPNGITGWTITGSGVDLIHDYWDASEGEQSVDVNAGGPGSLSTELTGLVIGQSYTITFDMSGNPEIEQGVKELKVETGGTFSVFQHDTTGESKDALVWDTKTFTFVATSETQTLTFTSLSSGPCGPILDNVTIVGHPVAGDDDGGTCVTGCLNVAYGADGPADGHLKIIVDNGSQALHLSNVPAVNAAYPNSTTPLTSGGHTLVVLAHSTDSNGVETLVVGYKEEVKGDFAVVLDTPPSDDDGNVEIFTLTLHTDPCDPCFQDFKFELQGPIDHALAETVESNLLLAFGVVATDNDGDTVSTDIKVQVNDDSPDAAGVQYVNNDGYSSTAVGLVDEDHIFLHSTANQDTDSTPGDTDGKGTVFFDVTLGSGFGGDGPGASQSAGFTAQENDTFTAKDDNGASFTLTTADGHTVLAHAEDNGVGGFTLIGYFNSDDSTGYVDGSSTEVFTLAYNSTGSPLPGGQFNLREALAHPIGGTEDNLMLSFGIKTGAADGDGDPVIAWINIKVNDDGPQAVSDSQSFYDWTSDVTGNVLANDKKGADDAKVTQIAIGSTIVEVTGTSAAEIAGLHGTFFVAADGSYTYTPNNYPNGFDVGGTGPGNDSLTYTVTDGDGDTSTTTLDITFTPPTHTPLAQYDEYWLGNISYDLNTQGQHTPGNTAEILDLDESHVFTGDSTALTTIYGKGGDDTLNGGSAGDLLFGGDGKDSLHGGGGDDTLFGGNNDDDLYGEAGHDAMSGGAGDDTFHDVDAEDLAGTNTLDGIHTIDGGTGEDTVELGSLATFGSTQAAFIENVEHLDFKATGSGNPGTTVTLNYEAVYGITQVGGLHVLTITGDKTSDAGGDNVVLDNNGAHAFAFDSNAGGFNIYTAGSGADQVVVKVQEDVAVA